MTYSFTEGPDRLVPTLAVEDSGVTASNFTIASGYSSLEGGEDVLRIYGSEVGNSTANFFDNGKYLSFSVTIPAGTVVNLASLSLDYYSTFPGVYSNARVYSSIHGYGQSAPGISDLTIGTLGKASSGPSEVWTTSSFDFSSPQGSGVMATDFNGLTDTTVTFYIPWIDNGENTNFTDIDDLRLTFTVVPEASAASIGILGAGLLVLRRRRGV